MPIKKIVCIAMTFPAPTETFHSNNTKALTEQGKEVIVFSLLPRHKDHSKLVLQRGLSKIKINSCDVFNCMAGCFIFIIHPLLSLSLLRFILFNTRGKHLVKSLSLIPRVFYIWSKICREKPDVVNLLWGHYPVLVGFLIKRTNPEILLSMGLLAYDLEMGYGGSGAIVPYVDYIWTQASINVAQIEKLGFNRIPIRVIYDGLDPKVSLGRKEKQPFSIITIGRLIKSKGIELCIRAFSIIANSFPESYLHILGDGPERKNLKDLAGQLGISEKVTFKGHVSMEEVAAELAASDVFLFMSYKERLPNVVKEAMLNKTLCIVSKTPGIEELVQQGQTGFILKENSPEEAAKIIHRIFSARGETEQIRDAAYDFVLDRFDCRKEMSKLVFEWENQLETRGEIKCVSA